MSIQTIIKAFVVSSLLSLGLAGVSWSEDIAEPDAGETPSVDAALPADTVPPSVDAVPPSVDAAPSADAADEDASAEEAEAADMEKAEAADD